MRSLVALLTAAGLALGIAGCGSEPAPAPAPAPAAPTPAPAKVAAEASAPQANDEVVKKAFAYEPEGLRDPFQPFLKLDQKKKKEKVRPQVFVPKTPLQRYAVEELRLVGVIWSEGGRSRALIEDPQGKGYVVGAGTLVGDRGGRLVRIQPHEAVVEERAVDLFGEESVNVVKMALHKPEDEVSR